MYITERALLSASPRRLPHCLLSFVEAQRTKNQISQTVIRLIDSCSSSAGHRCSCSSVTSSVNKAPHSRGRSAAAARNMEGNSRGVKPNICTLRGNNSVKQSHAGLDVFFFSDSAGTLRGTKLSHYTLQDYSEKAPAEKFNQAELLKRARVVSDRHSQSCDAFILPAEALNPPLSSIFVVFPRKKQEEMSFSEECRDAFIMRAMKNRVLLTSEGRIVLRCSWV